MLQTSAFPPSCILSNALHLLCNTWVFVSKVEITVQTNWKYHFLNYKAFYQQFFLVIKQQELQQ